MLHQCMNMVHPRAHKDNAYPFSCFLIHSNALLGRLPSPAALPELYNLTTPTRNWIRHAGFLLHSVSSPSLSPRPRIQPQCKQATTPKCLLCGAPSVKPAFLAPQRLCHA